MKWVVGFFVIILFCFISYADVPDQDLDGVPDDSDNCPRSDSYTVDQYGCTCAQKNCPSDNNECTDDCKIVDGFPTCEFESIQDCRINPQPQISGNGMSPSGIVHGRGDPTWITLRWPDFNGAVYYNVRLDDGTSERADDPRFETCPNSLHYYCENLIEANFIDGVPIKPGRNYTFWVDPIIPERGYFNIGTQFYVLVPGQTAQNSGNGIEGDIAESGDFIITSLALNSKVENQGPQSTIVIVASIGNRQPPIDVSGARESVFGTESGQLNDFYIKNSYGKASLTGKVVGIYRLAENVCQDRDVLDAAVRAADREVDFRQYSRIIIFVPRSSCVDQSIAGRGSLGKWDVSTGDGRIRASISWNFEGRLDVSAHELGHNFGLGHAGREGFEYGDCFSVMGSCGTRHLSGLHKEAAGWLDNSVTTRQGEYLLKPIELNLPQGSIQQLKLPTASDSIYSLSYRQPIDYDSDARDKYYTGVFIHTQKSEMGLITDIVNSDFDSIPLLQVGKIFRDRKNNYDIMLKSANENGALVSIEPHGTFTSPLEIISPNGGEIWEAGSIQTIRWRSKGVSEEKLMNLKLMKEGRTTVTSLPAALNTGSMQIEMPQFFSGSYFVEIEADPNLYPDDKSLSDESDGPFIIRNICSDSDGGKNYGIKGRTANIKDNQILVDECHYNDDKILFEMYCGENENDLFKYEKYACPTVCRDGACSSSQITSNVISAGITGDTQLSKGVNEVEGELEVAHIDDFEHPENSRYIHYIVLNGKRYEIKSEKDLPVVASGAKARLKGKISGNNFLLENYLNAHPELNVDTPQKSIKPSNIRKKDNILLWLFPLIGVLVFALGYFVFRRRD